MFDEGKLFLMTDFAFAISCGAGECLAEWLELPKYDNTWVNGT